MPAAGDGGNAPPQPLGTNLLDNDGGGGGNTGGEGGGEDDAHFTPLLVRHAE